MSREVRRVPLDFDWPLHQVWAGYQLPDRLRLSPCAPCGGDGGSPEARELRDRWYGYAPFHPSERGSQPLTVASPEVRARAERNVSGSPHFYGAGEAAVVREAQRLADLWNAQWSHHLNEDDVAALLADGRLVDLTHTWSREDGWQPKDPPCVPTAAEVNAWSLSGFGHDSINQWTVVGAELDRRGLPKVCSTCDGAGHVGTAEQVEAYEAWRPTDPPSGDAWQLWETVSEGSPVSPVFGDRADLIAWLTTDYRQVGTERPLTAAQAEAFVSIGHSAASLVAIGGQLISGEAAVLALSQEGETA